VRARRGRRVVLGTLGAIVVPSLALVAWAGSRQIAAERALLEARALDAAEAEARAAAGALADQVAARIGAAAEPAFEAARGGPAALARAVRSGAAAAAVTLDGEGRPLAPALPPAAGAADRVSPATRAAIEAGRDLAQRFRDPGSAVLHFARLLEVERDPAAEARLLLELAATHAAEEDWPAAAAVAERALALEEDARPAALFGTRDHVHLALLRIEALARAHETERARGEARRLARELELAAAAGSFTGADFGLRRLEELLGASPLDEATRLLDRAAGRALRRGAVEAAIARARAAGGLAVLEGAPAPLGLRAVEGAYILVPAGLGEAVEEFVRTLERRGVAACVRDPYGAVVTERRAAGAEGGRVLPLRGPFAGFTAEVGLLPGAARAAIARETRLLLGAFGAAGAAIALALFLLVHGAFRSIELESTRSRFVAGVTHDLKTPLALIRMYAETLFLGREAGADERRRFLGVIIGEADRLHGLVENVLAFQRRGVALDLAHEDLAATVRETAAAFAPPGERDVPIELVIAPDLPPVPHDRGAVERIVRNLFANAARFAPPGTAVRARLSPDGAGARLEVADEGPGIPDEVLPRVFDPFFTGGAGGTGLGLTIVRDLAEAHGGSARVRPNRPRGTVAEVWLPARKGR
jgi:signal transduction histidine kinase